MFVQRGDQIDDLIFGHAHLGHQIAGDVVEGLTVHLLEGGCRAVLTVQIVGQAKDHVEVGFQFQDGLFVSHHTNSISEP